VRRRHVAEAQETRERITVKLGRPAAVGPQRLELGTEQEASVKFGPVKRLDAEAISNEIKHPLAPIPQRYCEHSDQALDHRLDTPLGGTLDNNFGIAMSSEAPAGCFEFQPQFVRVIDLAVVGNDKTAA
jgi:hypothetical protein